jgi:hypothetical protein
MPRIPATKKVDGGRRITSSRLDWGKLVRPYLKIKYKQKDWTGRVLA